MINNFTYAFQPKAAGIMGIWYATREDVMSATDVKTSARLATELDRDLESASRAVELTTHRVFYPWSGTHYFDWPGAGVNSYQLWLDQYWLQSITTLSSGGVTITDYLLEPYNEGPPYDHVELNRGTNASWSQLTTSQRAITVTGLWGFGNDQVSAGTITAAINASVTTFGISDSSLVGVGSLIYVGTERMIVTGKALVTTGTATAGADLTTAASNVTVPVVTGTAVNIGERITVDSETMQVVDRVGNNLTVKRAVDGTVLAAHTSGATVYAPRTLTVIRGATGTTAASALISAPVSVWLAPGPVRELTIAYATRFRQARTSGYGKAEASSVSELESRVKSMYGRLRFGVV